MKAFVEHYWGPTDPTIPIRSTAPSLRTIKRTAFQNTGAGPLMAANFNAYEQQDAHEALTFLHDQLRSYDTRRDQFDAMFRHCLVPIHTCTVCGTARETVLQTDTTLVVTIDEQNHNTIEDAIRSKLETDAGPYSICESATCEGANTDKLQVWRIRATPRILAITLAIFGYDGTAFKRLHALTIGNELDLTRYQEAKVLPLKYKLSSVVSHSGHAPNSGHYVASVRSQGDNPFYNINDRAVWPINATQFHANPQHPPGVHTKHGFQAYTLTYIYDEVQEPDSTSQSSKFTVSRPSVLAPTPIGPPPILFPLHRAFIHIITTKMTDAEQQGAAYEEEHVHAIYERIASHFSATRYKPWPIIERFLSELPDGAVGADVGCGNGKYLTVNPRIFMVASDRSTNLVKIAKQHQPHDSLVADIMNLPHPNHSFDFAISIAVIHHISTPERRIEAVKAILELLRPPSAGQPGSGGRALIYVWALEQKDSRRGWDEGNEQDVMVPWVMRAKKEKEAKKAKSKDQKASMPSNEAEQLSEQPQDKTFLRYYHLYRKGELEQIIGEAGGEVVETGYDKDNWWAIVTRQS
ncbi:hypothetical protein PMIN07_010917 [Paraphaeosphaeria minitans]